MYQLLHKAHLRSVHGLTLAMLACGVASTSHASEGCGYELTTGTRLNASERFVAYLDLQNRTGDVGTEFELLLDTGSSSIIRAVAAQVNELEDGYSISPPPWLADKTIKPGKSHRMQMIGAPGLDQFNAYIISINGLPCDTQAPEITLAANHHFFTANGTLELNANASDNSVVRKVEFAKNGEVIAVDHEAPFELTVPVNEALNGFHTYTATAYDPSGNSATTAAERVFVSIDNKFFGTAVGAPVDYEDIPNYFNQITPENSGKWGSVESERDVMNWAGLDTAYQYAKDNGLTFKFHTLLWGQQQPAWLDELPPAEQLEEIEEWMSAVAVRYPDLSIVEVVNEPLHAPPAYIEALGGQGESGWDWLITAFELGRKYFPESQLVLNDYQILILSNFTQDYLNLINLLIERGLIDAIGLQAHFLERGDATDVATNLNTLAATGLPIYISELDLNFANDAQHANVMSSLFPVFWENDSVVGVTHWGHLEGRTWQENAYLLNQDRSERPGMSWIVCYLAGNSDCSVPEYIPSGWQGDEYGISMEAELYDQGSGIVALGSAVAYTDDGDWIAFLGVNFESDWDTFSATYAKGNTEIGSISIHLDALESDPILVAELPPTAGWGSSDTLEFTLPSISGERNVYVRFNDTYGVANLDSIAFGKERPAAVNILPGGDFEGAALSGWQSWNGSSLTLNSDPDYVYSGTQSLLATARPNTNQYAVYNLTNVVAANTTYLVNAQMLHTGADPDTLRIAAKVECATPPEGHNTYPWLQNLENVPGEQWTQLSAQLVIPDCDVIDVAIFFEGTSAGVDVYLDDISVTPPSSNLFPNGGFESALSGWSSWNGSSLTTSSEQFYSGSQSLFATNRPDANQYAVYNLTNLVSAASTYTISAQVFLTQAGTARMAAKIECGTPPEGHNTYPWLINNGAVAAEEWTELSAQLVIPDCDVIDVAVFFEGTEVGTDVYLDDITLIAN